MDLKLLLGLFICVFSLQFLGLAQYVKRSDRLLDLKSVFPTTRPGSKVKFFLYNRQRPTNPEVSSSQCLFSTFDNNKTTKVFIHGYTDSNEGSFAILSREVFLSHQDVNLIFVDWSDNGARDLYSVARWKVQEVGKVTAECLDNLYRQNGVELGNVSVIGFSLGAHVAGHAGYNVKTGKIGVIMGLDPAGPGFDKNKPDERLSKKSGSFVIVIHTCGKFLGIEEPIGHVDFFPNDGNFIQPGCGIDLAGVCSHWRAVLYFLESIKNPKAFPAVPCQSWDDFKSNRQSCNMSSVVYMGEGLPPSTRGNYYLDTKRIAPFGLGRVW